MKLVVDIPPNYSPEKKERAIRAIVTAAGGDVGAPVRVEKVTDTEGYLTLAAVSKLTGLSTRHLANQINGRKLKGYNVGTEKKAKWLLRWADVEEMIKKGEQRPDVRLAADPLARQRAAKRRRR